MGLLVFDEVTLMEILARGRVLETPGLRSSVFDVLRIWLSASENDLFDFCCTVGTGLEDVRIFCAAGGLGRGEENEWLIGLAA